MSKNPPKRSIQFALLTMIGLGTLLIVVGAGAAINSFNIYLPIIARDPTPTPSPVTVCSNPSKPIPEQSLQDVTDTMQTGDTRGISDLDVALDVSHEHVGDLIIKLQHLETNTTVTLIDRPGFPFNQTGCQGMDIKATLDDEAGLQAEDMCNPTPPAISGELKPDQPLGAFDGQSISGNWRLLIRDRISQDGGRLNSWCLTFQPSSR